MRILERKIMLLEREQMLANEKIENIKHQISALHTIIKQKSAANANHKIQILEILNSIEKKVNTYNNKMQK